MPEEVTKRRSKRRSIRSDDDETIGVSEIKRSKWIGKGSCDGARVVCG
jgi:hypothetical protein